MTVLRLKRRFEAPRERVFDAWTDPTLLSRWWAALAGWETSLAEVDLRPQGSYRLSMRDGTTGAVHTVMGKYVDVRRPERLAYTWTWQGEPEEMRGSEHSLVEVDFVEDGDATEVVVRHSGFADARIRDLHGEGWSGCLANLEQRVFGGANTT